MLLSALPQFVNNSFEGNKQSIESAVIISHIIAMVSSVFPEDIERERNERMENTEQQKTYHFTVVGKEHFNSFKIFTEHTWHHKA